MSISYLGRVGMCLFVMSLCGGYNVLFHLLFLFVIVFGVWMVFFVRSIVVFAYFQFLFL